MKFTILAATALLLTTLFSGAAHARGGDSIQIVRKGAAPVLVDANDYPLVTFAANLYADDIKRVTGKRPAVETMAMAAPQAVIAGTLGRSGFIDRLAAEGRLKNLDKIRGRWEATLSQVVENPLPGVGRALVIVGSDRRGTAYGLMQLSEKAGVSPWYWWADVPVLHQDSLTVAVSAPQVTAPGVKYRGIFINDEDWGFAPWAKNTLDPDAHIVGPKAYEKVFELMLRLRLNYIWPAMHGTSKEFGSLPENTALAGRYGIVTGASHCEPMLYNNVKWPVKEKGDWNYQTNRDTIYSTWENTLKERGDEESVWTLGIRGIHDRGMNGPKDLPSRVDLVSKVIGEQRGLLNQVTDKWGPVAQCFVPYKEVQPIYDAGLEVPPDVTLVWADDNFGYLRRLSSPQERKRAGGAGFYYHLSYYGTPHSYTWINTTAPALMWEEMHKAWENEAKTIWVVNVGDIKPMEIGIDYLSKLAWNPDGFGPNSQPVFLRDFAARTFGEKSAQPIADLLADFYALGTLRKPELMNRAWAQSLSDKEAALLSRQYRALLQKESVLSETISPEYKDAYEEMVGYPARVLGSSGLIFMDDRFNQSGHDTYQAELKELRDYIDTQTKYYNEEIAGGKWNLMMSGPNTASKSTSWSSLVRWPWYEAAPAPDKAKPSYVSPNVLPPGQEWKSAADFSRKSGAKKAQWVSVAGLGRTSAAMALLPVRLEAAWNPETISAKSDTPRLEYDFVAGGDAEAFIAFLPTFRVYPGMKLRVAVQIDNGTVTPYDVPGSGGKEDENGQVRRFAVQENDARLRVPLPGLIPGKHTLRIYAVDPGAVIDRVSLPQTVSK